MSINTSKIELLTAETQSRIDEVLAKFPHDHKNSAILMSLHAIQEQNQGWISEDLMDALAEYLNLAPIMIYEVATFYDMYDLKPCGQNKIRVCTNVSCMLRGSDKIMCAIKKKLAIDVGESTKDNKFILKEAECLAACTGAPMMQINNEYYENLTPEKVDAILDEWRER